MIDNIITIKKMMIYRSHAQGLAYSAQKAKTARPAARAREKTPRIEAAPRVLLNKMSKSANKAWSCLGVAASYSVFSALFEESFRRVTVR